MIPVIDRRPAAPALQPLHDRPLGSAESPPASLPQLLLGFASLLRRRVWIVLLVAAATLGITAYRASRAPTFYRATAVVRLSNERQALSGNLGQQAVAPVGGWETDERLSQIQVLRSRAVVREVVDSEGLRLQARTRGFSIGALQHVAVAPDAATGALRLTFGDGVTAQSDRRQVRAAYGAPLAIDGVRFTVPRYPGVAHAELAVVPLDEASAAVQGALQGALRDKTDIVDVSYVATDPGVAQRVVDRAVETFRLLDARTMQQRSRRRRMFLEEQLAKMDTVQRAAQLALNEFRSRQQTFSPQDKFKAQQRDLGGVDVRRQELDADRRTYATILQRLQRPQSGPTSADGLGALVSSPAIAENPIVAQLVTQLLAYQGARDSLTTGRWASTPGSAEVRRLDALIAGASARVVSVLGGQIAATDARIAALDQLKARSAAEMSTLPPAEAEEVRLLTALTTAYRRDDQLRDEVQKAQLEEAVEAGRVELLDAALPGVAIGSTPGAKLLFGLVLGLMLGAGAGYLVDGIKMSIRGRDELQSVLNLPPLALIPQLGAPARARLRWLSARLSRGTGDDRRLDRPAGLVTISDPRSVGAEAFRTLRTNILFSQAERGVRTIVVTSACPSEGKSTTAANLGVAFAQQGLRVLLVDCDLRRASLHRRFGVSQAPGLTQLLMPQPGDPSRALSAGPLIRTTAIDGLFVLPAGPLPPNPAELIAGARMQSTLDGLSSSYDLIILDTPPVLVASDAVVLGKSADGVVFVVCAGRTDRGAARQAVEQLASVGARILGAALNDPDAKLPAYRYGGYHQYDAVQAAEVLG